MKLTHTRGARPKPALWRSLISSVAASVAASVALAACGESAPCPSGSALEGVIPTPEKLKALREEGPVPSLEAVCVIPGAHGYLRHGVYRRWFRGGEQLQESITYEGGVKNGPFTVYYEDGQKREEGTYEYNLKQGRFTTYHRNGKPNMEGTYVDGKMEGDFTVTSADEMHIQKGPYFHNTRHGKWTSEYIPLKGAPIIIKAFYHYGLVVNEP